VKVINSISLSFAAANLRYREFNTFPPPHQNFHHPSTIIHQPLTLRHRAPRFHRGGPLTY
ncbi:MAG: hypothetical protein LIP02_15060, partial [Bacteroidales bacterium]|nr:hypothetical protein [Bacteroidales bacterium]